MNISDLIETLVSDAQLAVGNDPAWLQKNGGIARAVQAKNSPRMPAWTREEDQFLIDNLGELGVEGVAEALGRSANAIKIHFMRKGVAAASKQPGWITANQASKMLGLDAHKVCRWIDEGIMPGERLAWSVRVIRRVRILDLKLWLIRPTTWTYIDSRRIVQSSLRRLVQLAQQRWGDEWWTNRQAADYHGCDVKDILRQIKNGKIEAFHAVHLGGRDAAGWSLWFVKKSEAVRLVMWKGKGSGRELVKWSARADEFILRAKADGKIFAEVAGLMKWPQKRVEYRYHCLVRAKGFEGTNGN